MPGDQARAMLPPSECPTGIEFLRMRRGRYPEPVVDGAFLSQCLGKPAASLIRAAHGGVARREAGFRGLMGETGRRRYG